MASSDLTKFYTETCKRIETLEKDKRELLDRRSKVLIAGQQQESTSAVAAGVRAQCVAKRFKRLEMFHSEFRLIEKQLKQRIASNSGDAAVVEGEIKHWKKRFLTRLFVWQSAITHDHWYFTWTLIHLYLGNTCGRHPLCGIEAHLKPLVDPAEQDSSKWRAAFHALCNRDPMPGLVFAAVQTSSPPSAMYPIQSRRCPVSSYAGKYSTRISQLLGSGQEVATETGVLPGGIPTFLRLFGNDAEGEFVRFVVICNLANDYVLVDFSQSQAARAALIRLFRSPSIEKVVWNKGNVLNSLRCTLWTDPANFNEVYDLSAPWNIGSGDKEDDIGYGNEVSQYFNGSSPSTLVNGKLSAIANVLFHIKELGEIFGSSIIDVTLNEKSDWVMNDATVGWERIDPRIFVSLVVTATTISDVAVATAILNPNWRMGLGTCPSILSMTMEQYLNRVVIPSQCVSKVMENAALPLAKCHYNSCCIHDFVIDAANVFSADDKVTIDKKLADIETEIKDARRQKNDLEQLGPWMKTSNNYKATPVQQYQASIPKMNTPAPVSGPKVPPYSQIRQPNATARPVTMNPPRMPAPAQGPTPAKVEQKQQEIPRWVRPFIIPNMPNDYMYGDEWGHMHPASGNQLSSGGNVPWQISPYKAVELLQRQDTPAWVRPFIVPRQPMTAELDQDWAKVPVPRLTFPVYYNTLEKDNPLYPVFTQWCKDFKQAFKVWSRPDPWSRNTIFLGALATDAQLLACRTVQYFANAKNRPYYDGQLRPYKASLVGLLINFCAYVDRLSHLRPVDAHELHVEKTEHYRLLNLMKKAMAEKEHEVSSDGKKNDSRKGESSGSMEKKPNAALVNKTANIKRKGKPPAMPRNTRLFYDVDTDPYALAIMPELTFEKLESGYYLGAFPDDPLARYTGTTPHSHCALLPAQILPPRQLTNLVSHGRLKNEYQTYDPFQEQEKRGDNYNADESDDQGSDEESMNKKMRMAEGFDSYHRYGESSAYE